MRLGGKGLPGLKGGSHGDLFVRIHVTMPKQLTEQQRQWIIDLQNSGL
jgi:DnaJ-class molecular chaperone